MFQSFLPTEIFADIYRITPDMLTAAGIRGLILDIDNTLVTYDDPTPTPSVTAWLNAMLTATPGTPSSGVSKGRKITI